tara:strand:+ start:1752 stop:2180 length:429 start_codon:yes stop_codon:yes gene_type:complete
MNALFSSFIISFANADTNRVIDFETIDKGSSSKYDIDVPSNLIEIYSKDHWEDFWKKHTDSGIPNFRTHPSPKINFAKYYVLVAIDRSINTGVSSIEIKEVEISPNHENKPFSVVTESKHIGPITMILTVNTRPFHIIKIKK